MALIFGTAGLPHILVRFYTVPDAQTARISVVWAMVIIGIFYIMTTFLGFGAATIVGTRHDRRQRRHQHERAAARAGARRRRLLRLHLRHRLRHDSRRRRRADDQRIHVLRARFLHERHASRHGAHARAKRCGWRASRRSWSAPSRSRSRSCWVRRPTSRSSWRSRSPSPPRRICR